MKLMIKKNFSNIEQSALDISDAICNFYKASDVFHTEDNLKELYKLVIGAVSAIGDELEEVKPFVWGEEEPPDYKEKFRR